MENVLWIFQLMIQNLPFEVIDSLNYDLVLGMDFLCAFAFLINFKNGTYSLGGRETRFLQTSHNFETP